MKALRLLCPAAPFCLAAFCRTLPALALGRLPSTLALALIASLGAAEPSELVSELRAIEWCAHASKLGA